MNYEDKIQASIRRIQVAAHIAERHGEPMTVCFSGGKDSQVMLHLVQRAGVPYRAAYSVTTIDHPANVNFIRKNYPQVEFVHPKMNFWQLIEKKKMLPMMTARFCCEKLKEYYGNGVIVTGVRRDESTKRAAYPIIERDKKKKKKIHFRPIIDWLEWEVWQYIEDNGLPENPCYDFGRRVGCMVCPFAPTKQLISVFNEFPNLKKKMLNTIHKLRANGYGSDFSDKTDEDFLNWWMSKKNIREYFQPTLFDSCPSPVINFTHLEPLDYHSCNNCAHLYLDIDTGYFCPVHREVDFGDKLKIVMVNDCTDFHTEGNDAVTSTFSRRNH